MIHSFTTKIKAILFKHFQQDAEQIYSNSELLKYINLKTKSASKGAKARGSFGNLYAIYVLVEDYINGNFHKKKNYSKYEGAKYSDLLKRQRELPFGSKLQNHALNQRMNQEFKKYFPTCNYIPIIRVVETKRYWINSHLIKLNANGKTFNIAKAIIEIIDEYANTKKNAFETFIKTCEQLKIIEKQKTTKIKEFVLSLLEPNVDARIFEIVSYAILKYNYQNQIIYWGFAKNPDEFGKVETFFRENLELYKTGRTNANDGGIDFVLKPLGRFFQVTETTDVKKYFLDIDKLKKFPITFVVKSTESKAHLKAKIKQGAIEQYAVDKVVERYMACIEEIINIDELKAALKKIEKEGNLAYVLSEIIIQSKVEFNYNE
ncbi:MAG: hypothetical protein ACPG5B_17210 [Chitinophagales bacterium]